MSHVIHTLTEASNKLTWVIREQWRLWSECTGAKADLALYYSQKPTCTFSQGQTHIRTNKNRWWRHQLQIFSGYSYCRCPLAQSVATWAVNLEAFNPSSAYILSDFWQKSTRHAKLLFYRWDNSLWGKEARCLERLMWESQETHW